MTIRELASLIDVSPSTISIVLNGKSGVGEETRQKVLKAMETYHYTPPVRSSKETKNILLMKYYKSGMFVEENQGFISMIINAIGEQLREEQLGMNMLVAKTDLKSALATIDYSKYCGMIVIGTEITGDDYGFLKNIPIPFVVVDNTVPNYNYNSICMNNYENVWLALQYCKECGHKEIGYLGSLSCTENFMARYKAFRLYVKELGLHFDEKWEFLVTPTMLGAYDDSIKILAKQPKLPSCFFAENDTIALGVMKALKEMGYKIPRDISLIGFDDIPYASISSPALTTVHVQRDTMGKQAVYQLLKLMEEPHYGPIKTQITGYLEIRDSVRGIGENQ